VPPRFLTLPFSDTNIKVQQGWNYNFTTDPHEGIDYVNVSNGIWQSFNVVASDDGWAMWTEQPGTNGVYGKFVLIRHNEKSSQGKDYFTLYAHLESVSTGIPKQQDRNNIDYNYNDASEWKYVKRGEVIGRAGNTGASEMGIHLHFEVRIGEYSLRLRIDPYDLYKKVNFYPYGDNYVGCGPNYLWTTDPPTLTPASTPSDLRDTINRRLQQFPTYPSYLLDQTSFTSIVSTVWMEFANWKAQTNLTERYNELYFTGVDYDNMRYNTLIKARDSLKSGDLLSAQKYLERSYTYEKLSVLNFDAAYYVFMNNLEAADLLVKEITIDLCEASIKYGLLVINPSAAKVADYILLGVDYSVDLAFVGQEQAAKNLIVKATVNKIFNEVKFDTFDGRTLGEYTQNRIGKYLFPMLNKAFASEELQWALSKIIKDVAVGIEQKKAEDLLNFILNELRSFTLKLTNVECPVEVQVYDSQGKVTGVINQQVKHEIPMSFYNNGTVVIFFPDESYSYKIVGKDTGSYNLEITSVTNGNLTTITANNIPTSANASHQYTINNDALSNGEEGIVTVQIDSDNDGTFEKSFVAGSNLTKDEFMVHVVPADAVPTFIVAVASVVIAITSIAIIFVLRKRKQRLPR
jgi:hypothetical protein